MHIFCHTKCGLRTLWALRSVDPLCSGATLEAIFPRRPSRTVRFYFPYIPLEELRGSRGLKSVGTTRGGGHHPGTYCWGHAAGVFPPIISNLIFDKVPTKSNPPRNPGDYMREILSSKNNTLYVFLQPFATFCNPRTQAK